MIFTVTTIFDLQKYLAFEDSTFEEYKDLHGKIESLESIIRLLEIKMKNAQDHSKRPLL